MKLYIPTCTLNFNNIFTTESISPASFYTSRGFGNKRYFRVEANDLDNVVMLYSKYPLFRVNDDDMENSPMIIEIESNDYHANQFVKVGEKDGVESYASNTTIYLNPFHCLIYFRSYQDIQSVMSKAEQSLENKYSKLYAKNCIVKKEKGWASSFFDDLFSGTRDEFTWNPSFYCNALQIQVGESANDGIIDKVKGCLTCYLLGANMSVSSEVSRLRQLARKMKNTLAAIVNSPEKKPTDKQDETLLAYITEFNDILEKVDENYQYNQKLIQQRLISPSTGLDSDILKKVLKDLKLEDAFYRSINLHPTYNAHDLYTCLDSSLSITEAYTSVIKKLYDVVRRIEISEQSKGAKKELKELVKYENGRIEVIDKQSNNHNYYNTLLNSQIDDEYKQFMKENGSSELLSIAFVAGAKLKTYMPGKWEGSEFQQYLNGLLSNIQQGDSFDLFSIEQPVLQALSAFCQKGENIDRLIDYMQQCGFNEFRYALGIYGSTRGFASLPKTFTDSLINSNKDYYKSFYTELCQALFRLDYSSHSFYQGTKASYSESLSGEIPSKIISKMGEIEPKTKRQERIFKAVSETATLEDAVQSPKAFMYILDSFPNMTRTKAYKNLKDSGFEYDTAEYDINSFRQRIYTIIGAAALKSQKDKIDKAIELEAKRQDQDAFLCILDNFLKPSDPAYKRIEKLIKPQYVESKQVPLSNLSNSSRSATLHSYSIINDLNAEKIISESLILPSSIKREVLSLFRDFQKSYQSGYYFKNPTIYQRNNADVIDHFVKFCLSDKNTKHIAKTPDNSRIMDDLKAYLMKIYHD